MDSQYIADYLRLDEPDEIQLKELGMMLAAAKSYTKSFTGLTDEQLNNHDDISIAILILVADYYQNRSLYLDYKYKEENLAVKKILAMHSVYF